MAVLWVREREIHTHGWCVRKVMAVEVRMGLWTGRKVLQEGLEQVPTLPFPPFAFGKLS